MRGAWMAGAALAIPAIAPLADSNVAPVESAAAFTLPQQVPGWLREEAATRDAPVFHAADLEARATFVRDGAAVQAFSAVYLHQAQGKELTGFDNRPLGEGFTQVSTYEATADGRWLEVEARSPVRSIWLVRVSYRIDSTHFADPRRAQFAYAAGSLTHDPLSSALVLRAACAADCAAARGALDVFIRDARLNGSAP
jgi:hypothetical protein